MQTARNRRIADARSSQLVTVCNALTWIPGVSSKNRLPLDGSAPSAIGAHGAPTDQFLFREDISDNSLNVLVRSYNTGDAFWSAEYSTGAVALLRIPLSSFGNGSKEASWSLVSRFADATARSIFVP